VLQKPSRKTGGRALHSVALKEWLYRSGILTLYHRIRNRKTLTVIMFHRVLDPADPRWTTCDPDYTISANLFRQCLELFVKHYTIVSLDDVLSANERAKLLPPRSMLLTFDDGWQDNFEYALPILKRMRLPAVLFVVAEAVNRSSAYFQEQLVAAWRRGSLGAKEVRSMSELAGIALAPSADTADIAVLRRLVSALESLDSGKRREILDQFHFILSDNERYNLSTGELQEMLRAGIRIGAHGMTHTPLTRVASVQDEILQARNRLSSLLNESPDSIDTLSCPHGKYDASVVRSALQAGCKLIFTSRPALNSALPAPSHLLARVGFEASEISDDNDQLVAARLVTSLFRRPIARLA